MHTCNIFLPVLLHMVLDRFCVAAWIPSPELALWWLVRFAENDRPNATSSDGWHLLEPPPSPPASALELALTTKAHSLSQSSVLDNAANLPLLGTPGSRTDSSLTRMAWLPSTHVGNGDCAGILVGTGMDESHAREREGHQQGLADTLVSPGLVQTLSSHLGWCRHSRLTWAGVAGTVDGIICRIQESQQIIKISRTPRTHQTEPNKSQIRRRSVDTRHDVLLPSNQGSRERPGTGHRQHSGPSFPPREEC